MKKDNLFQYLEIQDQSMLFDLLSSAFDSMDTNQKHEVFGKLIKEIPSAHIDAEEVLGDIEAFYASSIAGHYYAPFDINSKNFSDIPEETEEWFDEISDHLEDCSRLSDQGDHEIAVQCFKIIHELIDKMLSGDEIVFADEYGTWMITGDEKRFISSYLTSLSTISSPEEYVDAAIPLIVLDSYESFHNKVYSTALKIATEEQKDCLEKEVKSRNIKTKSKY